VAWTDAVGAPAVLVVWASGWLHPERGIAGANRVVSVGHRDTERRHDPVAHDLIHRALVMMDGLHHPLQDRIEESLRLLGVPVAQQFHGAP